MKQVKLRSKIRIEEGRAKPIDLLAKYINAEEDDLAIEMHEPYTYLNVNILEPLYYFDIIPTYMFLLSHRV